MILDDAKEHMDTLIKLLQGREALNRQYMEQIIQFNEKFRKWTPEVYVMVEGGNIQGASANCNMHFNLFDADNEKAESGEIANTEPYKDKLDNWDNMIDHDTANGLIKPIY